MTSQAEGSEPEEVEGVVVSAKSTDLRVFQISQSRAGRVGHIHILEVTNNLEHQSTFCISDTLFKRAERITLLNKILCPLTSAWRRLCLKAMKIVRR